MKVSYSHRWLIPLSKKETWDFFVESFNNSASNRYWPNALSTLTSVHGKIKKNERINATYKLGPVHRQAQYLIEEVISEKKIIYKTTPDHPLVGRSILDFFPETNGTFCHWHGEYQSQNLSSVLAIGWFKLIFEPLFFSKLERKTKKLQPGQWSKSA